MQMRRRCKNCIHYEVCNERKVCEDYYPLYEEMNDDQIDNVVESRRQEFRLAWHEYISQYN